MKIFILFLMCYFIFMNDLCFSENSKEIRYWTCYVKKSKIDHKYDEINCINTNTYIHDSDKATLILGCYESKIIPYIVFNKVNKEKQIINIDSKVDKNSMQTSKWRVVDDGLININPKYWLESLKGGNDLIIRLKNDQNSYNELEFDIGMIDEVLEFVSNNCVTNKK